MTVSDNDSPTGLPERLLDVLASGRAMTTSEIRDCVQGPSSGARPVVHEDVYGALIRMESRGLVQRARVAGRRKVYWRNTVGGGQKPSVVGVLLRAQQLATVQWSPRQFDIEECLLRAWIACGMPGDLNDIVARVAASLPGGDLDAFNRAPERTRSDVAALFAASVQPLIGGVA
ncbi:hypothetical protein B7435_07255 [Mycolicibacterium peregrinum]|uniref:hypothetical protein n=1 Tax=Mycolicibacterium peregrinum TaxID=43304 RepID=UPI000B4BAABD|nr:hypothetical protein [Mycolicibacterium peregrinum]OWM07718.1 hypothetical protein B7435_07255 [Mycolicibacterium peregrinum]